MSFKKYPKYKDSGVEWLGMVPEHWAINRLKLVFNERDERSESGGETLLSVSAYTGVTPRSEILDEGDFITRADSLEGYKKCYPDDLVVNIMLAWNRGLAVTRYEGIVSPAYCVYRIKDGSVPQFINYLMRSDRYILYFKAFSTGVIDSRLRIYPETFGALFACLPSKEEQSAIASFLDHETSKIDALISEQEKLIELLKEKRSAVISHAVTKGLNPDVKMKDSGVEWLGMVPEGWDIDRLKWSTSGSKNGVWGDEPKQNEDDIPCVRVADFDRRGLCVRLEEPTIRNVSPKDRHGRVLTKNDLLLEKSGGGESQPVGCVVLYADDRQAICSNFVAKVTVADKMDPSFWRYFHAALYAIRINTRSIKQTSGIQNLDSSQYFDEKVCFPSMAEQSAIASFLDQKTSTIDALIEEAETAINLFQERRSALISAAVTGQIDVRDFVLPKAA